MKRKYKLHGLQGTGIYYSWINMKTRTLNKNNPKYKSYGGRGIKLCKKWYLFSGFLEDMQNSWSKGMTIERIDVNGHYTKKNCKWIPKSEQFKNKQINRVTYKGESLSEANKRLGGKKDLVWNRIKQGWDIEKAFYTPIQSKRKQRYLYDGNKKIILSPRKLLEKQSK